MKSAFDQQNVTVTEFGVGLDQGNKQRFVLVPVDAKVQNALREMVTATQEAMRTINNTPASFDPSEKYEGSEHLQIPLAAELAAQVRNIHEAKNLEVDTKALDSPEEVFCYFARMIDAKANKLTGVRRATTFKGVLKSRLIRLATDALKIVEEKVFKLDHEFDFLVDGTDVQILHPAGFVYVGALEETIRKVTPNNIKAIRADLPFVEFAPIEAYALTHSQAPATLRRYAHSKRPRISTRGTSRSSAKAPVWKLLRRTANSLLTRNPLWISSACWTAGFIKSNW